jgi:predicted acyltransferase
MESKPVAGGTKLAGLSSNTGLDPGSDRAGRPGNRLASIDAFRGCAIVLMIMGNYLAGIRWIPAFLKHQPDIGLTFADLVAPMFIFAIALTIRPSALRRATRLGRPAAQGSLTTRCLSLIGIGAIITAGQAMRPPAGEILSWGVLQAIGAAGLLSLPFIFRPAWMRLLAGIIYLAVYQFVLDHFLLANVIQTTHNGLAGSLAWAALLLLGTACADGFYMLAGRGRQLALLIGSGCAATGLGLLLSLWLPISKHRASSSYMMICLGFCLLAFALFHGFLDKWPAWLAWLRRIGRNPLALYLAHLILLAIFVLPGSDTWYAGAPVWLTLLQASVLLASVIGLSLVLEKKNWIIRL